MGQNLTHAVQQNRRLFDDLIGAAEQREREGYALRGYRAKMRAVIEPMAVIQYATDLGAPRVPGRCTGTRRPLRNSFET
jgi:hypothetical protein